MDCGQAYLISEVVVRRPATQPLREGLLANTTSVKRRAGLITLHGTPTSVMQLLKEIWSYEAQ
jgi:hypothetical protein